MSMRTASARSTREMGLIKYFATPALSALVFHVPNVVAVSTTMGMPDVAGSCLSIILPSTAFISGRYKSVIMKSGRSAKDGGYVCEDRSCLPLSINFCANDRPAFLAS